MRSKPPDPNKQALTESLSTGCPQGKIELEPEAWDRFERRGPGHQVAASAPGEDVAQIRFS